MSHKHVVIPITYSVLEYMFLFFFFFKQKTAYEIASCLVGSEMCIRDRTTGVSMNGKKSTFCSLQSPSTVVVGKKRVRNTQPPVG